MKRCTSCLGEFDRTLENATFYQSYCMVVLDCTAFRRILNQLSYSTHCSVYGHHSMVKGADDHLRAQLGIEMLFAAEKHLQSCEACRQYMDTEARRRDEEHRRQMIEEPLTDKDFEDFRKFLKTASKKDLEEWKRRVADIRLEDDMT